MIKLARWRMNYPGKLIVFEGIDGSGKSTLAKGVYAALTQKSYDTVLTKEPGGTQLGRQLREILQRQDEKVYDTSEFLLFAADRGHHFHSLIIPALERGAIILSDRMADSSVAYQGYGRGVDIAMIKQVNAWVMQGVVPTLTVFVDIQPQVALERVRARGADLTAFEKEKIDFWERVRAGYQALYRGRTDVCVLDGTLPPHVLVDHVTALIMQGGTHA